LKRPKYARIFVDIRFKFPVNTTYRSPMGANRRTDSSPHVFISSDGVDGQLDSLLKTSDPLFPLDANQVNQKLCC
jgi:hypothetical protein